MADLPGKSASQPLCQRSSLCVYRLSPFFNACVALGAPLRIRQWILAARLPDGRLLAIPAIITLLYLTHPIHTEVAANIKGCDELLSLLFVIAAFNRIAAWFRRETVGNLAAAGGLFFLALLSKESAITCVAVIPLLAWFFAPRFSARRAALPTWLPERLQRSTCSSAPWCSTAS